MRKFAFTFLSSVLLLTSSFAQTLFTYGDNSVTKQEFLRVYQKNSFNKKPDFSEPALREYLDLYSLFRMKVKEAEKMQLDTMPAIQRELDNYRKQLAKNYLTDEQVTNKLVREAYDRMKEDRHIAHILLMAPASMGPADTLKMYQRADSIYNAITKSKADFEQLALQYSDDKGSKDKGGDIGYMTALQTIYPFENAAFNTEVGKVSRPFRTQLGYHIVKVLDTRPARGEVQVAQILAMAPKSRGQEGIDAARLKMDTIRNALKKGMSFEDAAKKYSDDKITANDGGVMPPIVVGKMVPDFENAAFGLKNKGDISAPVQTDYGFHILKLIKKTPVRPYDSIATQLKRQVDNDSRAQMARDLFFEKIKQKNGFKEFPANVEEVAVRFEKIPDTGKQANAFLAKDFNDMTKPVFILGSTTYTQRDMVTFAEILTRGRLQGPKKTMANDIYKMYVSRVVNDFEEHRLIEENVDFKNLMQEYRDGIMLFELMDQNVWGKASKDSIGLEEFFDEQNNKYMWEPGFTGTVYKFKDEGSLKLGQKALTKKDVDEEDVITEVNSDASPDAVTVQSGRYEFSKFTEVSRGSLVKGKASAPVKNADGSYSVVMVKEIFDAPNPKSLDDARGYVIAEYQDHLEKEWNKMLRAKYPLKVDEKVFKSMVQ